MGAQLSFIPLGRQVLPEFKYHPDPIATGSIAPTDSKCECCGTARGYVYQSNVYCVKDVEHVCPWCIADGSAHTKLDATFNDDHPLRSEGVSESIIEEVTCRTPGYVSWQQDSWLCCCNDACEFHGDATREELLALNADALGRLAVTSFFPLEVLPDIIEGYQPGGSPSFYKFVCRHCRQVLYGGDCD